MYKRFAVCNVWLYVYMVFCMCVAICIYVFLYVMCDYVYVMCGYMYICFAVCIVWLSVYLLLCMGCVAICMYGLLYVMCDYLHIYFPVCNEQLYVCMHCCMQCVTICIYSHTLALSGSSHSGSSEPNSSTHQLLQSYGRISERAEYLQQKNKIHSSAPVQNEILGIQAKIIPRQLADKLQKSRWYSIIVDRDLGRYKERAGCHLLQVYNLLVY